MTRIRAEVELDRDEVSPDAIGLAQDFLRESIESQAETSFSDPVSVDWNSFRTYTLDRRRSSTMKLVAWAKVL